MFNFLVFMVAAFIPRFSHSAYMVIIVSALILISLFLFKNIFIHHEMNSSGIQLIELKKTFSEEHSLQIGLTLAIIGAVFFIIVGWPLNALWIRSWTPWLIVIALLTFDELYASRYLKKGLMENGICTGHRFIKWVDVESLKWVRKNKDYYTLKIGTSKFYSYWIAYLYVLDAQKEDVDKFFKKRVGI
ncbi:hypothetical protein [Desulfosporosinus nitroreducens]|uniref:DUF5673 domain-containing protein n=1 Tax=Desulfosporosinus nitroreducens TaxID=2018668 RepID=A0ABT8QXG8_9FIRM|nr:hypothetical protein [Desulfosporosinus nitroreducens]MDO0826046.1 hypothetical protein [Desulfosporosinus nitroreducens]